MTQQLAANTISISRPIAPIDRGLGDAISAILNTAERIDGLTVVRQLPSSRLKRDIQLRQAEIRLALAPLDRSIADKERAARAVAAVLSGWVNARVNDPAAKVSAYIAILGDLPCWVVEQVCRDVARGYVDGLDPDFPPSAARLHQLGEEVIARIRREAADLEAVCSSVLTAEAQPSEAERNRIRIGLQKLCEDLHEKEAAERAVRRGPPVKAPTAEQLRAHYAKHGLQFQPKYQAWEAAE